MENAGALTLEYRVGKASVLDKSQDGVLEPHLPLLRQCGYEGKEGGDDIDFSKLTPDQAEQLNDDLFALDKQRRIIYAHYEPIMYLRRAPSLGRARGESNRQRKQHLQRRKEDVQSMRNYAETPQCKRKFLLNAFNETIETCSTCTNCAQASREVDETRNEPWLREQALDNDVLEQVYKPLDTLLRFLDAHQTYHEKYEHYSGIGKTRITMALQGKEHQRIQTATVWLKHGELNNPFFGHLSFIKNKEVEKALKEAVREGYLHEDGYDGNPIYRISDAGRQYLSKQNRSYFKRGNT
jgi:ATP-dependent DNA helicase RecQ